jgi:hypothetical protein
LTERNWNAVIPAHKNTVRNSSNLRAVAAEGVAEAVAQAVAQVSQLAVLADH